MIREYELKSEVVNLGQVVIATDFYLLVCRLGQCFIRMTCSDKIFGHYKGLNHNVKT